MKCTQCGCENLTPININSLFSILGDASMRTSESLKIYTCRNCGHLEFFDTYAVDKYNESMITIKSITSELQILRKRLSDLESSASVSEINDEIKQLERQLTSLDITIRQQQEFKAKVQELQAKAHRIPNEIAKLKKQIEGLERQLREAEQVLEKIEVIEG